MSWLLGHFLKWIEQGSTWVVNEIITSIAAAAAYILAHLPGMPSVPSLSGSYMTWVAYGNYWFPISYMFTLGAAMLTLWVAWIVLAIPLRWFKVARGSD